MIVYVLFAALWGRYWYHNVFVHHQNCTFISGKIIYGIFTKFLIISLIFECISGRSAAGSNLRRHAGHMSGAAERATT